MKANEAIKCIKTEMKVCDITYRFIAEKLDKELVSIYNTINNRKTSPKWDSLIEIMDTMGLGVQIVKK